MQIIQNIREKGAAIVIVVIALSLIGFLLMDARTGNNRLFGGGDNNTIGKVNGEAIEVLDFNKKVKAAEDMQEQRTGQKPSGPEASRLREQVWNQIVAEKIFFKEAEKLGINLTPKELSAILLSNDPSNPFTQERSLLDSATGKLDMAKAQEAINNIKKFKGEQKDAVYQQIIDPLKISTAVNKYSSLINASVYYPSWMADQDKANATNYANISYVSIPYTEISDSTVKVTDAEINTYVQKNKSLFKQEAGRKIAYVTFSQLPNAADSAEQKKRLEELKVSFASDSNAKVFVARNGSILDFKDDYIPRAQLPGIFKDTVSKLAVGTVFGPYADQGAYILAKVLGSRQQADSATAKHILIATVDPQTRQQIRDDSTAKKKADSLFAVIKNGGNFAALAAQFSDDPGSKIKGGDLGTFGYGMMVPEFNDFVFNKPAGSQGVVKTQFGYHIINVGSQKNINPAYKVAFVAKEIIPSDATVNTASLSATKAAAEKDGKALAAYAAKNGLAMVQLPIILKENDYAVGQMQDARQLVKWAFDAKEGQVSEPFSIGDNFVVATLVKSYKEGTQDAETARSGAEAMVMKQKKAAMIISKIGKTPTLEKAAADYNKQIAIAGADSSLTFNATMVNGLGMEPKVIGAAFNKDYQSKPSPAIQGTNGVYVVKTISIATKPAEDAEAQKNNRLNVLRNQVGNWYEGLKSNADIKDKRSKMF